MSFLLIVSFSELTTPQYTYTATMPLIIAYALGFCVIKYQEGYVAIPGLGGKHPSSICHLNLNDLLVVPKPYQLWTDAHRQAIFPLTLMFAIGWSFEMYASFPTYVSANLNLKGHALGRYLSICL